MPIIEFRKILDDTAIYECGDCGLLLIDVQTHIKWHENIKISFDELLKTITKGGENEDSRTTDTN
jgi:hypothetical protein